MTRWLPILLVSALLLAPAAPVAQGADWWQYRGPERNGHSPETDLLTAWPEQGPTQLWDADGLGKGFGSPTIADGRVYVTGMEGKDGVITCFSTEGELLFRKTYGEEWHRSHPGSRTTPTVAEGKVYLISGMGKAVCLDAASGDEVWSVEAVKKFGGRIPTWGIAESPLLAGKRMIVTPGGPRASVVALDRRTGETIWVTEDHGEKSAYCSPILIRRGETRLIITMTAKSIIGIDAIEGSVLWRHPHKTSHDVHAITPLYHDGQLYCVSGYGTGGVMLGLSEDGASVRQLWRDKQLDNHHGNVVRVGDSIYGTGHKHGGWFCLDWASGEQQYQAPGVGKGTVITANGMLYCYGERGRFGLVPATPEKHEVVSSFPVRQGGGPHWAHPAISDGRLYVRHGDVLMVYDIGK